MNLPRLLILGWIIYSVAVVIGAFYVHASLT